MESNSSALLKDLPDFTDLLNLAQEIKDLSTKRILKEIQIKSKESDVFLTVMQEDDFKVNGKTPSVSHFNEAYKTDGLVGEILPLRQELAEMIAELELLKRRFDIFEQMLDVWRTLSANERSTSI